MRNAESTARRSFAVVALAAVVMLCVIIEPIAGALLVAAAFAGTLSPLQWRLTKRLGGRPRASASILVFCSVALFIGPLIGLSAFAVNEAGDGIRFVTETIHSDRFTQWVEGLPEPLRDAVNSMVDTLESSEGGESLGQQLQMQGEKAAAALGVLVTKTGSFLFQVAMMLIALFFLLVYGKEVVAFVDRVSPLRRGQTQELLAEFKKVSYSVVVSTVVTALAQALAALIGYYIARVPHPVFFGALTFFMAMVPAVGAAVVCLLAALLLLITGAPYWALFLAIWGLVIVGLIDNIVKPLLIKGGIELHEAIVFFSLIGGLTALGLPGLILGPLVVAFVMALLRIYERDFSTPKPAE